MNIYILTNKIAPDRIGGSETQTLGLASELAKRDQVTVIVRRAAGLPRAEKVNGFQVKRFGPRRRWGPPSFRFSLAVFQEIRRNRKAIDVLLAKTIRNGLLASVLGRLFRIPVAVLIEGEQEYKDKSILSRWALRWVGRRSRILVQTPGIQAELRRDRGIASAVVPNGVYLSRDTAAGDKVIYIGRLIRDRWNDKGVRYLIEAARGVEVDTLIVGDGPEREALREQARDLPNVIFTGRVPPAEVAGYLKQGFVLVLPSLYGEGLPNVLLEAMALGLPAIATRTAGISDIIQPGKTGFLVMPGNAREMREHILLLWRDKPLRDRLGRNCREEAQKYSWDKVAGVFQDTLKSLQNDYRKS
jgi:glycosyltransferase involved in cell wall biosynthesis